MEEHFNVVAHQYGAGLLLLIELIVFIIASYHMFFSVSIIKVIHYFKCQINEVDENAHFPLQTNKVTQLGDTKVKLHFASVTLGDMFHGHEHTHTHTVVKLTQTE